MALRPDMGMGEYLRIFARRKWFLLFSSMAILFGASVYCVVVPEQFRSSTTILVIPQRVPEGYVKSTVSIRIEERLATIRQQVLSRTRLTAVMEELGLFPRERKNLPMEDVVDMMRSRIEIQVKESDAFTLSFVHEDPKTAMQAAGRLASFFIDENLKTREQQAVGTSEFLETQLQETKKRLEEQEEKVRQYKMSHMGELPQQVDTNLNALNRYQEQLKSNADSLRAAEDRKASVDSQIAGLEAQITTIRNRPAPVLLPASGSDEPVVVAPQDPAAPLLAELQAKKARHADLASRYTEKYPEVRKAAQEVDELEKRVAAVRRSAPPPPAPAPRPKGGGAAAATPSAPSTAREEEELRRQKGALAGIVSEIASLRRERDGIREAVRVVEAKVSRSPKHEQEMISLTRDYENMKASYDELLKKKLDADVAQNLEKRQKGEQFQVLDSPNLPEEPFRPDRKKIFGIAVFLALAVSLGVTVLKEMADQVIRSREEFAGFFDVPVIASIPVLKDREYDRSETLRHRLVAGGFVLFGVAMIVFVAKYSDRIRAILTGRGVGG
jgi:polysaccharide chain length determinant protein (PEP-CTERM system associated)